MAKLLKESSSLDEVQLGAVHDNVSRSKGNTGKNKVSELIEELADQWDEVRNALSRADHLPPSRNNPEVIVPLHLLTPLR